MEGKTGTEKTGGVIVKVNTKKKNQLLVKTNKNWHQKMRVSCCCYCCCCDTIRFQAWISKLLMKHKCKYLCLGCCMMGQLVQFREGGGGGGG